MPKDLDQDGGFYTLTEAAAYLRVSKDSVRRYVKASQLTAYRVGRFLRFTKEQLDQFVLANDQIN